MDAIAALYGSDGSDTDGTSDAEPAPTVRCVSASAGDVVAADVARGSGDGTGDEGDRDRPPKRKRSGGNADESPPKWKRAFAHVEGNWPSHVRVDIAPTEEVTRLVDGVVENAQRLVGDTVKLVRMTEQDDAARGLHISLSRPFVLTYDQIEPFVDALRAALKWRSRFQVGLGRAIVLVNDDATRSFLALQIGHGASNVVKLLKCVDKCMGEFGLQTYYEDPIPHASVASALGDSLRGALLHLPLDQLRPEWQEETSVAVRVASVQVAIGNKHFHIPLR